MYLIDLDGTLYRGTNKIDGADTFINYLNSHDIPYVATTNCPSKTARQVSFKLAAMDIQVPEKNIITSGMAAASALYDMGIDSVYCLGTEALSLELKSLGIRESLSARTVLVGYDTQLTYDRLRRACMLVDGGAALYATNPDRVIPDGDAFVPHTGAITAAIETACCVKAHFFGKPEPYMLKLAIKKTGCNPCDCIVLGDCMETDIAFAQRCGIDCRLLLTGVTKTPPAGIPFANSLTELIPG